MKSRLKLWEILRERAEKATIVLTSHYLNEIWSVCDRVLFLRSGRVEAFGRPEKIVGEYLRGLYSKVVAFGEVRLEGFLTRRAGRNIYVYTLPGREEKEIMEALKVREYPSEGRDLR